MKATLFTGMPAAAFFGTYSSSCGSQKAFLNRIALEGHKILNYGYAQGYKPLIDYLHDYMNKKGVNTDDKSFIITIIYT